MGRARVLLHNLLGYEETTTEEVRYRLVSQVKDYEDIWVFLNVIRKIFKYQEQLRALTTFGEYRWLAGDRFYGSTIDKVTHYASP